MVDLNIRDAERADRRAIRDLTISAYAEYAQSMSADNWNAYRHSILATLDGLGEAEQIVAEENDTILGGVVLFANGAAFEVTNNRDLPEARFLAVAPQARGRGIGGALMAECVERLRSRGASVLALHTMDSMQAAQRLYARLGFVRASELDFVPRQGILAEGYCLNLGADG